MSPCVLQSELTSVPFNHTIAPEDDFLVDRHPAQSLSAALSRRKVPLRELQRRVTRAIEVFHHPLGCHVVDITRSLQPLDCVQCVRSSSEDPLCFSRNGAKHSLSCLAHWSLFCLRRLLWTDSGCRWAFSRPSSRPSLRCNLKELSPGIHLK